MRQRVCFARTGARNDEKRSRTELRSLTLLAIECIVDWWRRRVRHERNYTATFAIFSPCSQRSKNLRYGQIVRRAPINPDTIVASLDAGKYMGLPLTSNV